jgi:hypothetical protein
VAAVPIVSQTKLKKKKKTIQPRIIRCKEQGEKDPSDTNNDNP